MTKIKGNRFTARVFKGEIDVAEKNYFGEQIE